MAEAGSSDESPRPDADSPTKGKGISRRAALAGSAVVLGAVFVKTAADALAGLTERAQHVPPDPTKVLGRPPSALGARSPFEQPVRHVHRALPSGASTTPLEALDGIITPADLHFERHHGGIPAIDPSRYQLLIHGMVDRPMTFSLADLKRFPSLHDERGDV